MKTLLLFLCGLVVGGFSGIWMDWSAHKNITGNVLTAAAAACPTTYTYELEDGAQQAHLLVPYGYVIKLQGGGVKTKTGLKMDFGNKGPCSEPIGDTCTINGSADKTKGYAFSCSDDQTDRCPDPVIQPTDPPHSVPMVASSNASTFSSFVADDFSHLFGLHQKK